MSDAQGLGWLENTVCCAVSVHAWGNNKGVKAADISQYDTALAEKAAEKRISVSKRLLKCKEYEAITSRDGYANAWFRAHSVPSLFKQGVYAVPTSMIEDWTGYLDQYKYERDTLVDNFRYAYDLARIDAKAELGALYREEDYPAACDVAEKFWVQVRYLELGVPGKLATIAPEAFQQAREDLARSIADGKAYIEAMLCEEVTQLAQGLRGALQGLDDGTLKRFHESHITKLQEWSALFLEARNVTDDTQLAGVVQELGNLVSGMQTEAVKKFAFVRTDVKASLDACLGDLKNLMVTRAGRHIDLESE